MIEREHVAQTSADVAADRIAALAELFPEAFADGTLNLERLGAALGDEGGQKAERYSFNWAGKRDAIRLLQVPSPATLVPAEAESIRFDFTGNLFIEGDNLEVLKLLYKSYAGRVSVIYIDPPYNSGNDFMYPDNFADPLAPYLALTQQTDEAGNLLTSNPETSGRYHSAWLSMMFPRLFYARQLLREDGAIFISIDDTEVHNLRMLMNEVFGEENFIAQVSWEKRSGPPNDRVIGSVHEYVLVYARSSASVQLALLPRKEEDKARYTNPDNDPNGDWVGGDLSANAKGGRFVASLSYEIVNPRTGQRHLPPEGACWRFNSAKVERLITDGRIIFGADDQGRPKIKRYLNEVRDGLTVPTIWADLATNTHARSEIKALFGTNSVFETPKPVALMKRIIEVGMDDDGIALDFFAGSCALAHAALELNESDLGGRRFIMIQLPEPTGRDDFSTIAEVGKERIRRVIKRIEESRNGELPLGETGDRGFRAFKLAESNFKPWAGVEGEGEEAYADTMQLFTDPLVDGWQPENVIWEVVIKEGFSLTSAITEMSDVRSNKVYRVRDAEKEQEFTICLDDAIAPETFAALGLGKDDLFICRDAALTDESAANLALQCRFKTM